MAAIETSSFPVPFQLLQSISKNIRKLATSIQSLPGPVHRPQPRAQTASPPAVATKNRKTASKFQKPCMLVSSFAQLRVFPAFPNRKTKYQKIPKLF
jgi:hypothetical protein